jgi:SAM-dependent methyltransferase
VERLTRPGAPRRGAAGPAAPRPPRQRRAFSTLGGPVELGGEAGPARVLGKLYAVDAALERALTHGFHSYAGRMHPSIARGAVAAFSAAGDLVVDPFCGSGTVLVEAMGLGRRASGVDASPLGVEIARVRTTLLGPGGRELLVAEAARIAEESGERARKRQRPEVPGWARGEIAHFFPHVLFELYGLRELVFAGGAGNEAVARALRLCLSSILVKFMKAGPAAPRDGAGKRIARGLPSRMFADRAGELARGLAALERRTPPGTPAPEVVEGDARALALPDAAAALVVSSPPYAGTYDYAAVHDARFRWLGLSPKRYRRAQLGARAGEVGEVAGEPWREAQARWMGEIARVLRPGGLALLMVGDGVVDGRPESAPDGVAEAGAPAGLEPVARASQARPLHDRRLAAIFADRPRREHLLLLIKRGSL